MAAGPAPARGGISRGGGREALALITEPLKRGDGWRNLFLGNTGRGKTFASKRLVAEPGQLTLIHDDSKAEREFPDVRYFESVAAMRAAPYDEVAALSVAAFRGDARLGTRCEVEEVCAFALELARAGAPVRVVVDETARCMSDSGKVLEAPSLRECALVGRTMGLSVCCSAQEVLFAPRVMLSQASSVVMFQLEAHDCNYLRERLNWDPEMLEEVAALPVGEFVLRRPAVPWNRTVYKFEVSTA